jgi:hypothetical protein
LCVFGREWTELPLGPFETLFWLETMKLPLSNNETAPSVQKKTPSNNKKTPSAAHKGINLKHTASMSSYSIIKTA